MKVYIFKLKSIRFFNGQTDLPTLEFLLGISFCMLRNLYRVDEYVCGGGRKDSFFLEVPNKIQQMSISGTEGQAVTNMLPTFLQN